MKRIPLLAVIVLLLLSIASPLRAANLPIPKPSSEFFVLDQANVLDQTTEEMIVRTSAALAQKTKAQIVVVTVNSLNGTSPTEYALSILRGWGIGDKTLNNGLLVLVSPTDRIARIEVGYGLEGPLPDAKTGQIQDEYMLPYFQKNDYNQGILNGYNALAQVVAKEYQVTLEINSPQGLPASSSSASNMPLPTWAIVLIVILILVLVYVDQRFANGFFLGLILGMLLRGRGGGGGGRGGGGGFGGGGGSGGG
ncbi:MAG TPA: TPM domain-containing protein, partial [Desulfosporosinus sp.]|nr:TPM domain-containing protein [Desulfosporosinus sp.]